MNVLIIILAAVLAVAAFAIAGLFEKVDSLTYRVLQLQVRVRRMEKKEENR